MSDRWIKLNTNWMDSEWLVVLSAEARLAWVQLICYAKTTGYLGQVRAKSAMVFARQNFIGEESVEQMLRAAKANGALREVDGNWLLTGWSKHQGTDETAAERMRRHREKKRGAEGAVTDVTRNVTVDKTRQEPPYNPPKGDSQKSGFEDTPPTPPPIDIDSVKDPTTVRVLQATVDCTLKGGKPAWPVENIKPHLAAKLAKRIDSIKPDDEAVERFLESWQAHYASKTTNKYKLPFANLHDWLDNGTEANWLRLKRQREFNAPKGSPPPAARDVGELDSMYDTWAKEQA